METNTLPRVTMNEFRVEMQSRLHEAAEIGNQSIRRPASVRQTRKVFNCIVDDTALVAGIKRSTRNGIRQWVRNGQIRLFVPLQALEVLSREKNGKGRHAEDVRETLTWLDEATSKYPHIVTLQGGDETYEKWSEVENFAVPPTLFSEFDHDHDHDLEPNDVPVESTAKLRLSETVIEPEGKPNMSSDCSDGTQTLSPSSTNSSRSSTSPLSPPTSPAKMVSSPIRRHAGTTNSSRSRPQSSSGGVPKVLQPLFNYILWRVHQELDPVAALETFIFLCNDTNKVAYAKGFDIKTKRLEQLRDAISREDRDRKSRQVLKDRELAHSATPDRSPSAIPLIEESAITPPTSPPRAPAVMPTSTIIDPNAYTRAPLPQDPTAAIPSSPRLTTKSPRGSPQTRHALPSTSRGGPRGGRGKSTNGGNGRGSGRGPRGAPGGSDAALGGADAVVVDAQIDPDSFARPRSGTVAGRGGRKLWVPT